MIGVYISFSIYILCIFGKTDAQNGLVKKLLGKDDYLTSVLIGRPTHEGTHLMEPKTEQQTETVDLKLYYESLCPGCRELEQTELKDIVNLLSPFLNITTYPYGNARTFDNSGVVTFQCQHGPKECYGNKLHACSLKHIANHTRALLFNICMMEESDQSHGSDDAAAAKCASKMNLDKDAIIKCANGEEGTQLHKYYGDESKKANFDYVPYVLINGVEYGHNNPLMNDVCAAFKNPPTVCNK